MTGVLVDKGCYTKDKANTTNEHKGMGATCAQDCAKKGNQVALVTSTGDVYDVKGDGGGGYERQAGAAHVAHHGAHGRGHGEKGKIAIAAADLKMVSK